MGLNLFLCFLLLIFYGMIAEWCLLTLLRDSHYPGTSNNINRRKPFIHQFNCRCSFCSPPWHPAKCTLTAKWSLNVQWSRAPSPRYRLVSNLWVAHFDILVSWTTYHWFARSTMFKIWCTPGSIDLLGAMEVILGAMALSSCHWTNAPV